MWKVGYCYPWDIDAPGFGERIAELNLDEVAVAVAYHSVRAATPWSYDRTSVLAEHSALYRAVRQGAWAGARLRPVEPSWLVSPDAAGAAFRALRSDGRRTAAWLVLTHNSRLGAEVPEVTVRNCFGERYRWALCPAWQEVRDYAAILTREALDGLEVDSVVLEACGQMGVLHQCQHEKTEGVWSPAAARLLSVCCCDACTGEWVEAGADPEELRSRLRRESAKLIGSGALDGEDSLPEDMAALLLTTRERSTDLLRQRVLSEVSAGMRVVLHGDPDPWATGALPGLTPQAIPAADAVVVQCWNSGPNTVDKVKKTRRLLGSRAHLGAYVSAVGSAASDPADMADYVTELGNAGASELHLYHLGLAGPARWPSMRAAVDAARMLAATEQ